MSRPILAQVNLAALASNLRVARERAAGAQVLAVVKANAYGHGLIRVLPALQDADGLALVELEGAFALRDAHYSRRILLIEGFFEPTGDGDVHVWPCLNSEGAAVVILELSSPSGEVLVQIGSRDLSSFIHQMVAMVPQGSEESQVDLDAEIEKLFA